MLTIGSIAAWLVTAGALVAISHVNVSVSPADSTVSASSGSFQTAVDKIGAAATLSARKLSTVGSSASSSLKVTPAN